MIYEYAPAFPKRKERLLCIASLLLGGALFGGSMFPGLSMPWILQLCAFACFVVFIMLVSLCIMRSYVYTVEERADGTPDFIITEYYGRRRTVVCRVSLSSVRSVMPYTKERAAAHGKRRESVKKFVYTAILFDEARYLVEIEEEERFLVCICANDGLLRILEQP